MGHVVGTRKVTRKQQAWYDAIQEAHLRKIKAAWQAREAAKPQAGTK
jgi:hypothetical protein